MGISFVTDKDPIPHFIGYDTFEVSLKSIVDSLTDVKDDAFPLYNIFKLDEKTYVVEMQVPSFKAADLTISLTGVILTITGKRTIPYAAATRIFSSANETSDFAKKFILPENIVINEIAFDEGTLHISFEKLFPDSDRSGSYPTLYKNGVTPKIG